MLIVCRSLSLYVETTSFIPHNLEILDYIYYSKCLKFESTDNEERLFEYRFK